MRSSRLLVSSCLLGLGVAVGYSLATRVDQQPLSSMAPPATEADERAEADITSTESIAIDRSPESVSPAQSTTATASIDALAVDASSDDRTKRSSAIIALASAPKAQALPILKRAVDVSSSEGDRQLALRSLYTLAVEQGDDDGRIRDTMRTAIYHSDDEGVSQSAQAYLEDLDVALAAAR
jgi:hypothetical protein